MFELFKIGFVFIVCSFFLICKHLSFFLYSLLTIDTGNLINTFCCKMYHGVKCIMIKHETFQLTLVVRCIKTKLTECANL